MAIFSKEQITFEVRRSSPRFSPFINPRKKKKFEITYVLKTS